MAVGSHDLSQAEKKIILFLQAEQIHKIHSKWSWVKKSVILSKNTYFVSCIAACQLSRPYFVIQFEINQVIQQPKARGHVDHLILFKIDVLNKSRHFFTSSVSPFLHADRNLAPSLMSVNDVSHSFVGGNKVLVPFIDWTELFEFIVISQ